MDQAARGSTIRPRRDDAVSSVMGTVLMLSITVSIFGGLSYWVLNEFNGDAVAPRASLAIASTDSGYVVTHAGGEPVQVSDGTLYVNVDGAQQAIPLTSLVGDSCGTLPSGATQWTIGESLYITCYAKKVYGDTVTVGGVFLVASNAVLAEDGVRGTACSDTDAPNVQAWLRSPADVTTATVGAVTVTTTMTDDCSGVDTTTNPTLHYRVNDGGNPAYTSAGAMTRTTGTTWQGSINGPVWSAQGGRTLEYYVAGQKDLGGNVQANTPNDVQSDLVQTGCGADTSPPTVQAWQQSPANVDRLTTGAVTVTATFTDACWGVDTATNPTLYSRLNDGSNPAYASSGAMTRTTGTTWQGTIADPTWALQGGKTLQYYVAGQRDLGSNVQANTPNDVQSDLVDATSQAAYVGANAATTGTVTNFANAQSASDGNAEASLIEGVSANPTTLTLSGTSPTGSSGVANVGNALADDGNVARLDVLNDRLDVSGFTVPGGATGISSVTIGFEGKKRSGTSGDPQVTLSYLVSGVAGGTTRVVTLSSTATEQEFTQVVTGDRAWTVANVNAMTVHILRNSADSGFQDADVDHVYVIVTYTTNTYAMSIEFTWSGVPAGTTNALDLRYRTTTDTFNAQVCQDASPTCGTWTTRGTTLNSASLTAWSYVLTAAEYNSGSPRVRFLDVTPTGTSQGSLFLEYARVVTT
ncbi:MAG TPA: type IV pilin N-terminal domain-containing protein [Candidatus Thermoplasmatota archaeon]|nr:type IV pilin N-terminal domain-containing protein [Candidatus Thermoplasmatota archaeon]